MPSSSPWIMWTSFQGSAQKKLLAPDMFTESDDMFAAYFDVGNSWRWNVYDFFLFSFLLKGCCHLRFVGTLVSKSKVTELVILIFWSVEADKVAFNISVKENLQWVGFWPE